MNRSVGAHFCRAAFSRWRKAITLFDALFAMRSSALPPSWKAMASLFCSTLSCACPQRYCWHSWKNATQMPSNIVAAYRAKLRREPLLLLRNLLKVRREEPDEPDAEDSVAEHRHHRDGRQPDAHEQDGAVDGVEHRAQHHPCHGGDAQRQLIHLLSDPVVDLFAATVGRQSRQRSPAQPPL